METHINLAKFWNRVIALLVDITILGIVGFLLGLTIDDFLVSIGRYGMLFGLAITLVYQSIFNSRIMNGQTIGKRILDIQVVDINGNTIELSKSFLRACVLSIPYFLNKMPLVAFAASSINIFWYGVWGSISLGVVVVYIFNKQTRQSLHDLVFGTFVATVDRNEVPVEMPAMKRTPFLIWGGLIVIVIIASILTKPWIDREFKDSLSDYSKILTVKGVRQAGIETNETTVSGHAPVKTYRVKLWVTQMPGGKLHDNKMVRDVVDTILVNQPNVDGFNTITVSLIREFNIGIASKSYTNSTSNSPEQWRSILSSDTLMPK